MAGDELGVLGLAGEEDILDLAEALPPGGSAAVVAVELLWAKELASSLASSGAEVLGFERIPAPVVAALIEAIDEEVAEEIVAEALAEVLEEDLAGSDAEARSDIDVPSSADKN